ncbi:unnamed protein product [Brassica rapa subsp. trilocularis]|uniref:(rape) hypothetical protein n=1 Tax=Brassica napus TaxID=3708 RepID=A0A816NSX1_BRANA|nr:unnamed protein product [Brassica napus]
MDNVNYPDRRYVRTGNILDVGNMVRKVTSVRQFRLNSMLYVSGPMNQQKATQEYSPIVNRLHLMSDLTTKKNKKNSKLPSSILLY